MKAFEKLMLLKYVVYLFQTTMFIKLDFGSFISLFICITICIYLSMYLSYGYEGILCV